MFIINIVGYYRQIHKFEVDTLNKMILLKIIGNLTYWGNTNNFKPKPLMNNPRELKKLLRLIKP